METLVAILFIGFGIWTFISPKSAFEFKAKLVKSWGVTMTATPKAYTVMRYIGLAVAIVGLFLYLTKIPH